LKHEIGSLADVLMVFKQNGVNLTKIQSVPVYDQTTQYSFHTDLEWDKYENYTESLKKIEKSTISISVLGEYTKAEIPGYKN
jgi:prephenate dehydratase